MITPEVSREEDDMRTTLRLAVCVVLATAMRPVLAQTYGCWDGETNVPFQTCGEVKPEPKKAAKTAEPGGGSMEPTTAKERAKAEERKKEKARRDAEFLHSVWEAP
jgi:hypothetical protein